MSPRFFDQFKVIFLKNIVLNFRSKEYIIDFIPPIICGGIMIGSGIILFFQPLAMMFFPQFQFGFFRSFVYSFVEDKSSKQKELQKIMGLRGLSYRAGWISYAYMKCFINLIIFLAMTMGSESFKPTTMGIGDQIFSFLLYTYASMNFVLMMTTFFSKPKFATDIISFIQSISTYLAFLLQTDQLSQHTWLLNLMSLSPQTTITLIFQSSGWNNHQKNLINNYSVKKGNMILLISGLIYYILYIYFDQTISNEYGTQKSKLFWINWIWKKGKKESNKKEGGSAISPQELQGVELKQNEEDQRVSYDLSSARFQENDLNLNSLQPIVQVRKLSKTFGQLKAVDSLSITLYEKQILCLLGHNGAGKTTTISLLTGMIKKNSGKIFMKKLDFDKDLYAIRQSIGYCPQQDVLYDNFTVEDHLRFIGQIKGKTDEEIRFESSHLIQQCQLSNQLGKISKILSGGNKRKLSLAMALMGGSSVLFLDEPSSGLDFHARYEIRMILMSLKEEGRTVILTTHHLDEAEAVSDRIGIMVKGQLLVLGKSDFIKEKFGNSYHLTISKKLSNIESLSNEKTSQLKQVMSSEEEEQLKSIVLRNLPNAIPNIQSPAGTVAFTLPQKNSSEYSQLFKEIEEKGEFQLDLRMNSLEDAFINIGMDENRYINPEESQDTNNLGKQNNFQNIKTPSCLTNAPVKAFWNQTYACFKRKIFILYRSSQLYFSFVIPLIVFITGILLSVILLPDEFELYQLIPKQLVQIAIFFFVINESFSYMIKSYAFVPVMERELKLKYSLHVMGCSGLAYWFGLFIFDFLLSTINTVIFLIICFAFSYEVVTQSAGLILLTTLSFNCSLILLSYLVSFIFENSGRCVMWSSTIISQVVYGLVMALALIFSPLKHVMLFLSPFLCLFQSLFLMTIKITPLKVIDIFQFPEWQNNTLIFPFIMLGQALVFAALIFLIEKQKQKFPKNIQESSTQIIDQNQGNLDPDVQAEIIRVAEPGCADAIKVSQMTKRYKMNGSPEFTAIQNNSFGVQHGEVVGLLGPNGAGKSTTFNVLTAFLPKTSGSVKLKNNEIQSGLMDVFKDVGICPQFDNIYPNLSVIEHLNLYGRIKGLKGQNLADSIQYYIEIMQLGDYRKVLAGNLSGGNKRKLCVSMALIGGSDILFFDEPSSGIDPIAKRYLWNTISQSLKLRNGAIVLTTHSMDEAEYLCQKIGILINGQFICYGSPQRLKDKYGEGYTVSFKTNERKEILEEIEQKFPKARLLAETEISGTIRIMLPYNSFMMSEVFHYFYNELVSNSKISDFQISQTSLASVFMYFSQFQRGAVVIQPQTS